MLVEFGRPDIHVCLVVETYSEILMVGIRFPGRIDGIGVETTASADIGCGSITSGGGIVDVLEVQDAAGR